MVCIGHIWDAHDKFMVITSSSDKGIEFTSAQAMCIVYLNDKGKVTTDDSKEGVERDDIDPPFATCF